MSPAPLRIVVNPSAGKDGDDSVSEELAELLPDAELLDVGDDDLIDQLERAAEHDVMGVCGGDGSINAAAGIAIDHGRTLAVFPGGTLNHFARDAGIESSADTAAGVTAGTTARIDVGRIDGQPFLNTASIGTYPELVDERERREDRLGKWAAMLVAAVVVMRRSEPTHLSIDGRRIRTWAIFIGNCRYEPSGLAPRERSNLDDGCFDIRWIDATMRFSRIRVTAAMLLGRYGRSVAVGRLVTDRVEIVSHDGPLRLARDGESFGGDTSTVVIEKDPAGLQIVVPPTA